MLVEPDRDPRTDPPDQAVGDPALRLGEWSGAREEDAAERPPAPGKVAIEVDPVRVVAAVGGGAVRVQVGDDPEVELARRQPVGEPVGDRDPGGLVAVDATDDE